MARASGPMPAFSKAVAPTLDVKLLQHLFLVLFDSLTVKVHQVARIRPIDDGSKPACVAVGLRCTRVSKSLEYYEPSRIRARASKLEKSNK